MSRPPNPEKLKKKQLDNIKLLHNRILSAYNFKEIRTWADVYKYLGFVTYASLQPQGDVSYQQLKEYLNQQYVEMEATLKGTVAPPPIPTPTQQPVAAHTDQSSIPFKPVKRTIQSEFNDCTVLALSATLNIPYQRANDILVEEGRKAGNGLRVDWLGDFLRAVGFVLDENTYDITLADALKTCAKGRYYVRTNDHAFAIIDGVVHDFELNVPDPSWVLKRVYEYAPTKSEVVVEAAKQLAQSEADTTKKTDESEDYGYVRSPNVSKNFFPYWFQKKAAAELKKKIVDECKTGVLLLSATGTGKTYIIGMLDRWLIDLNWADGRTWSHIPRLYITKTTVVEQTHRAFERSFNILPNVDTEVINIEQLRSKAGQYWVKKELRIRGGQEEEIWKWKDKIQPAIIYLDESQGVKNKNATQSQIIHSYNDFPPGKACLVSISATPFVRVSEARAFAVSTHRPLEHLGFPKGTVLTNENWPAYAAIIASPSKPDDYNQAAVERLMKDLEPWVVRVRGVRPQFDAVNGVKIIQFDNPQQRAFYEDAWERFLKEKAKIDAAKEAGDSAGICYLVVLLKFAMAAELVHAEHFARDMHEAVTTRGKAAVAAVKFKQTAIKIVQILNEKYGVPRSDISMIWGGGQTQLTAKQKAKAKVKNMEEKLKKMGLSVEEMIGDMGLGEVEDRVIIDLPEHLRLGPQDMDERQREIDAFQSGRTHYCIYTLKAGGVGLSLHHTDEFTTFKCRRKESGYAVEEDIPKVPVRPRETFVVVTYNAIELVQGVGRVPRLTSLSPTIQNVYCYAGTVEVDMGMIYSKKLRCLSAVVKQKEDWQAIIMGGSNRAALVNEVVAKTEGIESDESSLIDESEEEEDNGNGKE